jgi:hypothetical protein
MLNSIKEVFVPYSPFIKKGEDSPRQTERLCHLESLKPNVLYEELEKSKICDLPTHDIRDHWCLTNVISPYVATGCQVMTINRGSRHCPGPACVDFRTRQQLAKAWVAILDFFNTIGFDRKFAGWNWSPGSWGEPEMKGGGQSLPTKWHMMLAGFNSLKENEAMVDRPFETLTKHRKRLMGDNDYGEIFGNVILQRLKKTRLSNSESLIDQLNLIEPTIDGIGLSFKVQFPEIFSNPKFAEALFLIGMVLENLLDEISFAMTDLDRPKLCQIMRKVEKDEWEEHNLPELMADPKQRSRTEAIKLFNQYLLPLELLDVLWEPVRARCERDESCPDDWWRKGFAYSAVFYDSNSNNGSRLQLAPYVYVDACGLFEAQQKILNRLRNHNKTFEEVMANSRVLWELGDFLVEKGIAV